MNGTTTKLSTALVIALLATAAPAAATGGELAGGADSQIEAAAEAAAGAEVHYDVDASGAVEAAEDTESDLESELDARYQATIEAEQEAKADLRERVNETEGPEHDASGELATRAEAVNEVSAQHEDEFDESSEAETGYVDAGADVSAWARLTAFISGAADAVVNVFSSAEDEAPDEGDAKAELNGLLDAESRVEGDLRSSVDSVLDIEIEGPDVEPRLEGNASLGSVAQARTSAVNDASMRAGGIV